MKKAPVLLLILLGISPAVLPQSGHFQLNGEVGNIREQAEKVYLSYYLNNQNIRDSAEVKRGTYTFTGNLTGPILGYLQVKYRFATPGQPANYKKDVAEVFLEPGNIQVLSTDSFSRVTVTGSRSDVEYRKLQVEARPFNDSLEILYDAMRAARTRKDSAQMLLLDKQIDDLDAQANEKVYGRFVKKNPQSPIALYALQNWAGYELDPVKIEPVFNTLPASVRDGESGKDLKERIRVAKLTAVGQLALDFTQNDTLGKPLTLSSLRGKYLLLDFWASWCGPCRLENPGVVKAFNHFRDKGFYILGVSLDRPGAKDKWLQAIHADHLQWAHVSDLQFWNNAVARQYGIMAIPQNLLLDPQGKIIAKNLHGEELDKKLGEILNK